MKLNKKILFGGMVLTGLAGLVSCAQKRNDSPISRDIPKKEVKEKVYSQITEFPMYSEGAIALTTGDFDNDGDLDIALATQVPSGLGTQKGNLYLFKNDGKGNFSQ